MAVQEVGPVGGSSCVLPPATKKVEEKAEKKLKEAYGAVGKVTGLGRSISSVVDQVRKLPRVAKLALKGSKLLTLPLLPFTIKDCVDDIKKIGSQAPLKEKIRRVFSLVLNLDSVTESVSTTLSILELAKVVGEQAVQWIPVFNIVSYIIGFISLGLAGESAVAEGKLPYRLAQLQKALKKIDASSKADEIKEKEKANVLIEMLENLKKEGLEPLRKKLMLSKKANLAQRVDELSERLKKSGAEQKAAVKEAGECMQTLGKRAKLTFGLKLAELINKIITVVGVGLVTFAPDPISKLVGCVLLLVSSVFSLVLIGGKYFLISKNPFDPASKTRMKVLLDNVSRGIDTLIRRLREYFLGLKNKIVAPATQNMPTVLGVK